MAETWPVDEERLAFVISKMPTSKGVVSKASTTLLCGKPGRGKSSIYSWYIAGLPIKAGDFELPS